MELQTISQVSKAFNISTRTLRYYEQIKLLPGVKRDDYAYRTYDEAAILRLQQIMILRKLRIPLKQISDILKNEDAVLALEVFRSNLSEIDNEIAALSTIKSILNVFINRLNESMSAGVTLDMLGDDAILKIVDTLAVTKINFKEEKTMEDLNKANESLNKLKDVRIIYLPPSMMAVSHAFGSNAEEIASRNLSRFVLGSGLLKIKPDLRQFGFDAPFNQSLDKHGHEFWVTIPDDMEVPAPLTKKYFEGGLYAAHMIPFGAFDEWGLLHDWVTNNNPKYEGNGGDKAEECMWGCMEEHLNYINHVALPNPEPPDMQLDLLMPIREKK